MFRIVLFSIYGQMVGHRQVNAIPETLVDVEWLIYDGS